MCRKSWKLSNLLTVLVPGIVGFMIAMAISLSRWPEPSMHDDFGNLLVASTLLEGRLANPVPPAWQSMETFHVVFQPTYASKYPIGLGSVLALGKLLFGSFAAGLWLCAGLASSAMAWMVIAHFPRRWGMAVGLMTATHPYWQNGWSQEFTNGWLAVTGVALVLGGLLRIRRTYRRTCPANSNSNSTLALRSLNTAMVGAGCVLTLFSRPFEGGLVCGLLGLYFLPVIVSRGLYANTRFWRAALPGAAILGAGISLQLVINQSITGNAMLLPYQLHETQYGVAPVLIWQKPHEPSLGHRFVQQVTFHRGWSMDAYNRASSFLGYFEMLGRRMEFLVKHWGQLLAFAPAFLIVLPFERRRLIGIIGILLISVLAINCIPWTVPQYVSPLIPIAMFVACCVARGLVKRAAKILRLPARPIGIEYALFASIILFQCGTCWSIAQARTMRGESWETTWAEKRAAMIQQLERQPGSDVVFVRYTTEYDTVKSEWVFNDANIENSPVIWVRWGSSELNDKVMDCYSGRKFWLLEFNSLGEPQLREFERADGYPQQLHRIITR